MGWLVGAVVAASAGVLLIICEDFIQSWGKTVNGVFFGHKRLDKSWSYKKDRSGHYLVPRLMAISALALAVVLGFVGVLDVLL